MGNTCKSDEKPGLGSYECTRCHLKISLDEYDKLPPCPSCSNIEFSEI